MASDPKGKSKGNGLAPMSDYGQRAAVALDQLLPGEHRDKIVARMFNVSLRMAKYLRSGRFWTMGRLSQASAVLGAAFDAALVSSDARHEFEMNEIAERLARLEEWRAETDRGAASGPPPAPRAAAEPEGRAPLPHGGVGQGGRAADGGRPAASGPELVVGGPAGAARGLEALKR